MQWWWFVPNEEEDDNDDLCRTAAAARRRIEKRKVFRRWVLLILLNLSCSPSCHTPQHLFKDYKYSGNKLTKVILVHKINLYFQKPSQTGMAWLWNPSKLQRIPGQCIAMVLSSCFEFSSSFVSKKTEDWDISGVLLCVWVWIRELFLDTKNCQ